MLKKTKNQGIEPLKKNQKHEKSSDLKKALEVKTNIKAGWPPPHGFGHIR